MDEILKLDHIYEIAEGWRESFLSFCVLFERWLRGLQGKKKMFCRNKKSRQGQLPSLPALSLDEIGGYQN